MNAVDARGHRIAYERKGEGPPLILLHGYVGDRRMWRRQIDGLSDEFTVVAWDAPGYGGKLGRRRSNGSIEGGRSGLLSRWWVNVAFSATYPHHLGRDGYGLGLVALRV